jgi:hypothetical protein
MKRIALVGILLLLNACGHLTPVQPADVDRQSSIATCCRSHFLQGRWQLVHTLQARFFGGRQATLSGVTLLSPADDAIHCVLMSLEGFVLFEAVDQGREVSVRRAFGPFDNDNFARGIMADIRLMFFAPEGGGTTVGQFKDGSDGCRYQDGRSGTVVDIGCLADGGWWLRQSDRRGNPLRTLRADAAGPGGVSSRLTLEARGRNAYQLSLTLVEATALP